MSALRYGGSLRRRSSQSTTRTSPESVLRVVQERVVEHHALALSPVVLLAALDEPRVAQGVVRLVGVDAQPARAVCVVARDEHPEVVTRETLPVAPVRRDVLAALEHRKERGVEARNVSQERGGARRERAVGLDEAMRFEHERLPRDRVDAAARVLARQVFDVDHATSDAHQGLALAPNVRVPRFELREPRVVSVVVADEGGGRRDPPCLFGAREEPSQALGDGGHSLRVGDPRANLRQHFPLLCAAMRHRDPRRVPGRRDSATEVKGRGVGRPRAARAFPRGRR